MLSWWLVLVALLVFGLSGVITFARVDLVEMYRLMGYPQSQIELMQRYQFFQSNWMVWCMAMVFGVMIAYLVYVKKFFGRSLAQPG